MFTTVLVTRLVVFLVAALLVGLIVFGALTLAYRTRPVFVPNAGPNDPVARYRMAVLARLRFFAFGVPAVIGLMAGLVAQGYWPRIQLFLHGGSFGIADPQFGMDLGFYAFDLPFYRLLLTFLFVALFLAFLGSLVTHYIFGGIRLAAGSGALSKPARLPLIGLVGVLVLLKAVAYWFDRYELLSNTRAGKPFTGARLHRYQRGAAGQADPAGDRADLRCGGVLRAVPAGSAHPGDRSGAAAGQLADRRGGLADDRRAVLGETQCGAEGERVHLAVHPAATRRAYGLTEESVTYRDYSGNSPTDAKQVAADRATTSSIRLLDPNVIKPGVHPVPAGQNFYFFPDQLSIDRYEVNGALRDFVVAAREAQPGPADRQPARLDQPAHRLHPRQRVHRLPGQHRARDRQRPQPERRLPRVP